MRNHFKKISFYVTHAGFYSDWLRNYLPLMLRYWRSVISRENRQEWSGIAYLDLQGHTQRAFFTLAFALQEAAYQVFLRHNPLQLASLKSWERRIVELPAVTITRKSPEMVGADFILTDHAVDADAIPVVSIDFDCLAPRGEGEYRLPLGVHPMHQWNGQLAESRAMSSNEDRPICVFFAGNMGSAKYSSDIISLGFDKLNRRQCLDTVLEYAGNDCIMPETPTADCCYRAPVVMFDSTAKWVRGHQVFRHLAHSRFALCPSGVYFPHCHNLFEAIAMGAIPITEYGELLDPPLRHMQNCLAYRGVDGLKDVLRCALDMPIGKTVELRERCLDYYDKHLAGAGAVKSLHSPGINSVKLLDEVSSLRAHFRRRGMADKLPW